LVDVFDEDRDNEDNGFNDFVDRYTKSSNFITTSRVTAAKKTGNHAVKQVLDLKGKAEKVPKKQVKTTSFNSN